MEVSIILLSIFILFFVFSFIVAIRLDGLFSLFYFSLFVYSIFTQVSYIFFPELVRSKSAYFGPEIINTFILFVLGSFIATFGLFLLIKRRTKGAAVLWLVRRRPTKTFYTGFLLFSLVYLGCMLLIYYENYSNIRYGNFSSVALSYGYLLMPPIILCQYVKLRNYSPDVRAKPIYFLLLMITIGLFFSITVRTGSRNQIIALLLGFFVYEFATIKNKIWENKARFFRLLTVITLSFIMLGLIREIRNSRKAISIADVYQTILNGRGVQSGFLINSDLLQGDYLTPSLLLVASIEYDYIKPLEVIKSNICNVLLFVKCPTLSETVGSLLLNNISRKSGYAYFIFTEGFNFMGLWGMFYNAIVINLCVFLWKRLASSNNIEFSTFIIAILSMQVVQIVRTPSYWFIKSVYLIAIPSMLLFSIISGLYPSIQRK